MKKQFVILLSIEIIAGLIAIGLLLSDLGICSYLFGIVVFTLVLCPFFKCLKEENDELKKENEILSRKNRKRTENGG